MKIPIVYSNDGRCWGTFTPAVPGAYGQGKTRTEAKRSLVSAIRGLISINKEMGLASPFEKVTVSIEEIRV